MFDNLKENLIKTLGGTVGKPKRRPLDQILEPAISQIRTDVKQWRIAKQLALQKDSPKRYPLQQIFDEAMDDPHLFSQFQNRINDLLGADFVLKNTTGEEDEDLTKTMLKSKWFNEILKHLDETKFYGHTLLQLDWDGDKVKVDLIPRTNIEPIEGVIYFDYAEDKKETYRDLREYGTWLLEFGKPKDLGLINKVIAAYLFKKFAQSCWSELCEIYGIPPRVLKTDTQDKAALRRGEKMMKEMGAAAWIIIDSIEEFDFAKGVNTNGDVYNNLIQVCKDEISTLFTGAIIGQDTKHGSKGKEISSQNMLDALVAFDKAGVEQDMNDSVIPALIRIGALPEGTTFEFEQAEDLATLWKMVIDALPHYTIDPEWVKDKFGIEITGEKNQAPQEPTNKQLGNFFV